ncbi:MAG: hypothetical protein COA80_17565 [Leeuwenhoekiella sp.]|nr:MAG: hypothetical protein COA80_17565 [Leeuwenhoekiella sp.]
MIAACTLFEGKYHVGVAVLVNSLIANEFSGKVFIGYRGELPNWIDRRAEINHFNYWNNVKYMKVENAGLYFVPLEVESHLTNYKPYFMRDLLSEEAIGLEGLFYFDPDIVVTYNWSFYKLWLDAGIALVHEINNNDMPPSHPMRFLWNKVILKMSMITQNQMTSYINGGFCGVSKENKKFLDIWINVMKTGETYFDFNQKALGDSKSLLFPNVDQDALNIAAMASEPNLSLAGPDGMSFISGRNYMAHATGKVKPWNANFVKRALNGIAPKMSDKKYWEYADGPIKAFSDKEVASKRRSLKIASFISRFYKRS